MATSAWPLFLVGKVDGQEGTPRKEVRAALLYPADRAGALMDPRRAAVAREQHYCWGARAATAGPSARPFAGFFVVDF